MVEISNWSNWSNWSKCQALPERTSWTSWMVPTCWLKISESHLMPSVGINEDQHWGCNMGICKDWTRYYGEIYWNMGRYRMTYFTINSVFLWFNGIIMGIYFMNLHYLCQHMSTSWYEKNGPLPENGEKRYISHGLASFYRVHGWSGRSPNPFLHFLEGNSWWTILDMYLRIKGRPLDLTFPEP